MRLASKEPEVLTMRQGRKMAMIPKKIHYCWFGPHSFSRLHEACMQTWKTELSGYEIVRWDETNSPMTHPFVRHHYEKKHWAYVSDFVRLYALYHHGGIYLDTDVEVVRSFDTLLQYRVFMGYEKDHRLTSGVCGAQKGELFIRACMTYMEQRHLKKRPYRIAPEVITAVYDRGDFKEVQTLPAKAFYPYNPYDRDSVGQFLYHDVTPETFAIHHWAKSWKMGWMERFVRKIL